MESVIEAVKFVLLYGMEAIVVAMVGVTLLAGLYQMVRDKVQGRRTSARELAHTAEKRS